MSVKERPKHGQTDHEEHVTHTSGEESLLGGVCCTGAFVIESDQKVGTKSHQFPEDEQPEEGVGENHPKHTRAEQNEFSVKAVVSIVVDGVGVHVTDGKAVDEKAQE